MNHQSNFSIDYDDQRSNYRNHTLATSRRKPFVPLKDLLKKGHAERVQDYLTKMQEMTLDEVENGSMMMKHDQPSAMKNELRESQRGSTMMGTPRHRQVQIVDNLNK